MDNSNTAYNRDWRRENPERVREAVRRHHLKKKYGLTPEQYNGMMEKQRWVCAICQGDNINGRRLAVDHDHATGKVRGLLCDRCNRGIGNFRDNVTFLLQAANYLIKSRKKT